VLEHWSVAFAVRELIANALDEQVLTGTAEPVVEGRGGRRWVVRDFGRGLRYEHLTQNENPEKLEHPAVIGQFGIGLKDALAVFDRRGVGVEIRSRHGDITTRVQPKAGFPDVETLHGVVSPPSDRERVGTEIVLDGVDEEDVRQAQGFFRRYAGDAVLETTRFGVVLARPADGPGRVYVKGLLVAEEPDFLFSYDITDLNRPLRRALNRERTNVGRTAYSERIKDILTHCRTAAVVVPLTDDLARFTASGMHDELRWKDVAVHACRVLQPLEAVVFVTARQLGTASVGHARADGYRPVVVPDDIGATLGALTDVEGRPMFTLVAYQEEWNASFHYTLVDVEAMSAAERGVFALAEPALAAAGVDRQRHGIEDIAVSETMRLHAGGTEIVGVWEPDAGRIVVRRDQLRHPAAFCGTLLHEAAHAVSGANDATFEFEEALTLLLGNVASRTAG
jgi:hypothetical protein